MLLAKAKRLGIFCRVEKNNILSVSIQSFTNKKENMHPIPYEAHTELDTLWWLVDLFPKFMIILGPCSLSNKG